LVCATDFIGAVTEESPKRAAMRRARAGSAICARPCRRPLRPSAGANYGSRTAAPAPFARLPTTCQLAPGACPPAGLRLAAQTVETRAIEERPHVYTSLRVRTRTGASKLP